MDQTKNYAHDKTGETRAQEAILRELARLGGRLYDDDDITYEGTKLVIPEGMTIDRAIRFLEQKRGEMEKVTEYGRTFNYRPYDGAYCAWNVLKRTFGAVGHRGTMGFFGPNPPELITINTDVNKQEQIPWGRFELPLLPGATFETGVDLHPEYGHLFRMTAYAPKRYAAEVQGIFLLVEDELEKHSMYRGKAFDGQSTPEFVDLSGVDRDKVVYSNEVMTQLEVNVWAQLRYTDQFVDEGVPLKRAVLIHGPYGTGKTLAAMLTGQEAVENGWTFIKARPGRDDLSDVLKTARLYQPAVVFYEDVDQITDGSVTSENGISRLLDDFDGIEAKNTKILCVLTTNHKERIHKGMARPGRLDAMIEINELDVDGVAKLVKTRVGSVLSDDIDWVAVFDAALGYKPAFVTEFADRAMRYALVRNGGTRVGVNLITEDLVHAAQGLRPQFEVMSGAQDRHVKPTLEAAVQETVRPVVTTAIRQHIQDKVLVVPEPDGERIGA